MTVSAAISSPVVEKSNETKILTGTLYLQVMALLIQKNLVPNKSRKTNFHREEITWLMFLVLALPQSIWQMQGLHIGKFALRKG